MRAGLAILATGVALFLAIPVALQIGREDVLSSAQTERLVNTYPTIGLRADNGACRALRRPPDAAEREAFATIIELLREQPEVELAKLVSPSQPTQTVRGYAQDEARQISGCFARVPDRAPGWDGLRRKLDAALAASA